jgi:hypothetical protein
MDKTQINNPFALTWLMKRYGHSNPIGLIYRSWTDKDGRFMFLATDG